MEKNELKSFLDEALDRYYTKAFIPEDPICVPHFFSKKMDIEISGFFAAIFAWGQRKTIISKSFELMQRMDNSPSEFILNYSNGDLHYLKGFKHRTFNEVDLLFFVQKLKEAYTIKNGLEGLVSSKLTKKEANIEKGLDALHTFFFSDPKVLYRSKKHLSSPKSGSACKRTNMFLRWMVRKDSRGIDFGLWPSILPSQLICPLDLHVERVAIQLGILDGTGNGWKKAVSITEKLKELDPIDPIKYDLALFSLGVNTDNY